MLLCIGTKASIRVIDELAKKGLFIIGGVTSLGPLMPVRWLVSWSVGWLDGWSGPCS